MNFRRLGRPIYRDAFGEIEVAAAINVNRGTKQQAGQLVAGQVDGGKIGVHAGERKTGQLDGRAVAQHAHDFGDERGVGALPPVAAAAGRQEIHFAERGGAPVERRLLEVAVRFIRGHFGAVIAGDVGRRRLAGNREDIADANSVAPDGQLRFAGDEAQRGFLVVAHINIIAAGQRGAAIAHVSRSGLIQSVNWQDDAICSRRLMSDKNPEGQCQRNRNADSA